MKTIKYSGPILPKRKGKVNTLNAFAYLKSYLVNSKMYEEASQVRKIERGLELKLKTSVVPIYKNTKEIAIITNSISNFIENIDSVKEAEQQIIILQNKINRFNSI